MIHPRLCTSRVARSHIRKGENCSECSSADPDGIYSFLREHSEADLSQPPSDVESAEHHSDDDKTNATSTITAESLPACTVCLKPVWTRGYNYKSHHCREYCTHTHHNNSKLDLHNEAPAYPRPWPFSLSQSQVSNPLLPPEVAEIAASAVKPLSRKKIRRLGNLESADEIQNGEIHNNLHLPALAVPVAVPSHNTSLP